MNFFECAHNAELDVFELKSQHHITSVDGQDVPVVAKYLGCYDFYGNTYHLFEHEYFCTGNVSSAQKTEWVTIEASNPMFRHLIKVADQTVIETSYPPERWFNIYRPDNCTKMFDNCSMHDLMNGKEKQIDQLVYELRKDIANGL